MAWSWWDIPFMVAALVVGIGPAVWAIVLDGRAAGLQRDVLRDLAQLSVTADASDGVRSNDRFSFVSPQRGERHDVDRRGAERGHGGDG